MEFYHETIRQHLTQIKENYEPLKNNIIEVVAIIRVADNVRFHSLFGYLNIFFRDIFPTVNEKAIKTKIDLLVKQVEERTKKRQT